MEASHHPLPPPAAPTGWDHLRRRVLALGLTRANLLYTLLVLGPSMCISGSINWLVGRPLQPALIATSVCVLTVAPLSGYLILRLLYELEASRLRIRQLAITDELTHSYNRRHFAELGEVELLRARRYGTPLALILVDADHFKQVNDTHGHQCGDQLLREIALACRATLRSTDILARFGGEELIVLLPQTDLAGALAMAERIRQEVARLALDWREKTVEATVSLGVAALRPEMSGLEALIHDADVALYDAKRAGRNRVCSARYGHLGAVAGG
ncbi:GGDEF domain-containing protein [Aquabacterium sp. A7-Y]|uniref:GGDEF domain-containing protein n=1 Tax=Aquabacterium sp. A7-Y TaxID=1349605 RepID=UPI00223E774A|nr:GGDEF domain-containing protein [Aquabacterium sp. A7-Y]MCW7537627.1 GGDEF domain-containing protein [Aquabacterium sp. A7-Y]